MLHVVKKTHKGELALGDEDLSDLTQVGGLQREIEYRNATFPGFFGFFLFFFLGILTF